ncbi:glycoside hydrolase family 127 protein [Flammeovirga sp. MY04]|uniref:glycoside hydrolase family 127 protein n=1 Tax=Flammeovirga sp. MY04 TaxID=1191459 RepID=UPI0008062D69|nr:beta-L-arabinofuranosidase domain-containing protein [Flammeovirga sp. MY04]ANQ52385.1 glycoside hydrolase family 127 protein [Flammeovirga sp. MY04]
MKKLLAVICAAAMVSTSSVAQENKGILGQQNTKHVELKSINIGDCKWTEGFWADRFHTAEHAMVPYMGEVLTGEVGHALNNFKIAAGLKDGKHKGMRWHDGDFYKWMEAAMYVYAQNGDENLRKEIDNYIEIIAKAQAEDGYLQTQVQLNDKVDRYENRKYHEMYNTGHLLTSACIHHRITGQDNFLNIAIKHADHLYSVFSTGERRYGRFGFNQTQIMGLVEMYRTVGDEKYLKLAETFINNRGTYKIEDTPETVGYPIGDMVQERVPLRESKEAVGHAVLALYYYAGAADVAAETGEKALVDALDRLWENVTDKKMYVTGAVGQAHYGASTSKDKIEEGFIDAYMMPNTTAYNETCANVCNSMFSYRMLGLHGESKYADIMELVLFNSGLSGISIEGKDYFYSNPLRMVDGAREYGESNTNTETPHREPYLECFCCPPNIVRTVAKSSNWAYSLSENGISVNLYGGNRLETKLEDGSTLILNQVTNYPWEGLVNITVEKAKKKPFDMMFRIPDWAIGTTVKVNGEAVDAKVKAGEFAVINRTWKKGDIITIDMPMEVTLVEANPLVEEARNQVAVKRGPIVYCVETPDLPQGTKILDIYVKGGSDFKVNYDKELLGGVATIEAPMLIRNDHKIESSMYSKVSKPDFKDAKIKMVPYFSWSNRGQSEMTVFLPVIWNNL